MLYVYMMSVGNAFICAILCVVCFIPPHAQNLWAPCACGHGILVPMVTTGLYCMLCIATCVMPEGITALYHMLHTATCVYCMLNVYMSSKSHHPLLAHNSLKNRLSNLQYITFKILCPICTLYFQGWISLGNLHRKPQITTKHSS